MEFNIFVHKIKSKHYYIILVLVSIVVIYFNNPLATTEPLSLKQVESDNCTETLNPPPAIDFLFRPAKSFCSCAFTGFARRSALLRDLLIDPTRSLHTVDSPRWVFRMEHGYFRLHCPFGHPKSHSPSSSSTKALSTDLHHLHGPRISVWEWLRRPKRVPYEFEGNEYLGMYLDALALSSTPLRPPLPAALEVASAQELTRAQDLLDSNQTSRMENATGMVKDEDYDFKIEWTSPLFVLTRVEFQNMYHMMCDLYNVYVTMRGFGVSPDANGAVLLLDTHPHPILHTHWTLWRALFASVLRVPGSSAFTPTAGAAMLTRALRVRRAVWVPHGHTSPLYDRATWSFRPPLLDDFRAFVRRRLSAQSPSAAEMAESIGATRCDRLSIVFLSRGSAARTLENEAEFVHTLSASMPSTASVRSVDMAELSLRDQLLAVHHVDALVGVHGAHFVHMLFLTQPSPPRAPSASSGNASADGADAFPKTSSPANVPWPPAVVFELFPRGFSPQSHWFYKHLAALLGLRYAHWANSDPSLERANNRTHVPPAVARHCATELLRLLECTRLQFENQLKLTPTHYL